ncbi:MAG: DUF402 domain-containing protein [Halobacteriaceae archaeon]
MSDSPTVRVRGIYATALTAYLADVGTIVDASPPIRARFDRDFDRGEPAVRVSTTTDRQGVEVTGDPGAVDAVREHLETVGADTLAWTAEAPRDAVYDGRVTETTGGGAVLDLGTAEGYLPFDAVEQYVEVGDTIRARVTRPAPPWRDDRPVLGTDVAVSGTVATLERDVEATVASTPRGSSETELARTTELIDPDLPDQWGIGWQRGAIAADLDVRRSAIESQIERARQVEAALEAAGEVADAPRRVVRPLTGVWVWFGRASRFALDERRRSVAPTLNGHHRIKTGSDHASDVVDFAERLGATATEFPVEAVLEQFGPLDGDQLAIRHGKPDGRCYALGRGEVTERDLDTGTVVVERELSSHGTYDGLEVTREPGDIAQTRFREGRWWYPTTYRSDDGTLRGTYLNVNTPVEVFPDAIRYVDLHVDVVKWPDGEVAIVDEDELEAAVDAGHLPAALADRAEHVAEQVADAVRE